MEFQLVLSLIFQYPFLTAFGQKRLVSYLAVPYSLSLIKHTACTVAIGGGDVGGVQSQMGRIPFRSTDRISWRVFNVRSWCRAGLEGLLAVHSFSNNLPNPTSEVECHHATYYIRF